MRKTFGGCGSFGLWRVLILVLSLSSAGGQAQTVQAPLAELLGRGSISFALQPDNKLIAYGTFDRVGNVPRRNLARFNADGSLDTGWVADMDGTVWDVLVDPSGAVFVAGKFKRIAGVDAVGLVKIQPGATAQLDAGFSAALPVDVTQVNALARASDGSIYAAYDGPGYSEIGKFASDGSADAGFDVSATGLVLNLLVSADQQSIFAAGTFTTINATSVAAALVKLNAGNGVQDLGWVPLTGTTANVRVRDMELDGAGHLLLAGRFTAFPSGFLRVDAAGTGTAAAWGPTFTAALMPVQGNGLARYPNGDWLAVGNFLDADAMPRKGVARLAPDGTLRTAWGGSAPAFSIGSNPNGVVDSNGIATIWRFAGGDVRTRGHRLADADGGELGGLSQSGAMSLGQVSGLVRQPGTGRIFAVGAGVAEVDGRVSHGAAAFDASLAPDAAWSSRLSDLISSGGTHVLGASAQSVFTGSFGFHLTDSLQVSGFRRLDGATGVAVGWDARADAATAVGNLVPTALAVDEAGGHVYVSGSNLRDVNNASIGNGTLLRFSLADGISDHANWNPAFTGSTSVTPVIAVDNGFLYYATGRNVTATDSSPVASLARISLAGNGLADAGWKPFATPVPLRSLAIIGAHAYVGGDNVLARVDIATGTVDPGWTPGLSGSYSVRSISVSPSDGSVYLAGTFPTDCLGQPTTVLRLAPGGAIDTNWGVAVDAPGTAGTPGVLTVLALDDGSALVGGTFRRLNGKPLAGLGHVQLSAASEYCDQDEVDAPVPVADAASLAPAVSGSGRFIAFQSLATTLDGTDTDPSFDIYRVDTECVGGLDPLGAACERVLRVSLDDAGSTITGDAVAPTISADGALVGFVAADAGVTKVHGESRKQRDARQKGGGFGVYMRNLITGNTFRMGTTPGTMARPQLSPAGNVVVFPRPNGSGDPGKPDQVEIYATPIGRNGGISTPGTATCLSCKAFDAAGNPTLDDADGASENAVVSADGTWMAWQTTAKNLLPTASACANANSQIILRNLISGVTQRMGNPTSAAACSAGTGSAKPALDYSGRKLVFESDHELVPGAIGTNVYYLDVASGLVERVSAHPDGGNANGNSGQATISGDGETVAFVSSATNIDPSEVDSNGVDDVFVYSIRERVRRRLARTQTGTESDGTSQRPALSYTASKIVFDSIAGNIAATSEPNRDNVYERANPVNGDRVFKASFE